MKKMPGLGRDCLQISEKQYLQCGGEKNRHIQTWLNLVLAVVLVHRQNVSKIGEISHHVRQLEPPLLSGTVPDWKSHTRSG